VPVDSNCWDFLCRIKCPSICSSVRCVRCRLSEAYACSVQLQRGKRAEHDSLCSQLGLQLGLLMCFLWMMPQHLWGLPWMLWCETVNDASTQHGNTLGIENTGSTSWKPLHCSLGHAGDDDACFYVQMPVISTYPQVSLRSVFLIDSVISLSFIEGYAAANGVRQLLICPRQIRRL